MRGKATTRWRIHVALAVVALVASTGFYSFPPAETPINVDSAVFSYIGQVMAEGGVPYVDVFDHKGPLLYLVNLLGALGPDTWVLWLVEWLFFAASLGLGFEIGRACAAPHLAAAVASALFAPYIVLHAEGGNMTEEYCLPFMLASVLVSVRVLKGAPLRTWQAVALGACWASIALLRFTELLGLAPFAVAALATVAAKRSARFALARAAAFLLGFAVVGVPVAAWLGSMGALSAFASQYFAFNAAYASDADAGARWESLGYFAGDPGFLLSIAAGVAAFAICWARRETRCGRDLAVLAVDFSALAAVFALAASSGRSYGHYLLMFAPFYFVPVNEAVRQMSSALGNRAALSVAGALVGLVLVYLPASYAAAHEAAYRHTLAEPRAEVVDDLREAASGDEVLVVGNECWVYLDGAFRAPAPYAYRSDAMVRDYDEWLAGVVTGESPPSAIAVADYVQLEVPLSSYRLVSTPPGFSVYQRT